MKTTPLSCRCGHRNPLHCIIPPYITDHMLEHGDEAVRRNARENLSAAAAFRAVRAVTPTRSLSLLGNIAGGKYREIYHAQNGQGLPGKLLRVEGGTATGDAAADEAYEGAGATYDFYQGIFGRNSLDDHGLKLISSVHVGTNLQNAFWTGGQMAYGDGDGRAFSRFTRSLDVIGHELTHGVVSYTADLVYQGEPGALNEHFADVFGTLVKQWKLGQAVHQASWLVGEDIVIPAPTRRAVRSLADPGSAFRDDPLLGSDPQPKHYANRYTGTGDFGGVHVNSGIPNHAFYLAATALGGKAWETVGPVWYTALTSRLSQNSTFAHLRDATIELANVAGTNVGQAVRKAWTQVGL